MKYIPLSVGLQIEKFLKDDVLTVDIDESEAKHWAYVCYLYPGYLPYERQCIRCNTTFDGCRPEARLERGIEWDQVCDVYCLARRDPENTRAPVPAHVDAIITTTESMSTELKRDEGNPQFLSPTAFILLIVLGIPAILLCTIVVVVGIVVGLYLSRGVWSRMGHVRMHLEVGDPLLEAGQNAQVPNLGNNGESLPLGINSIAQPTTRHVRSKSAGNYGTESGASLKRTTQSLNIVESFEQTEQSKNLLPNNNWTGTSLQSNNQSIIRSPENTGKRSKSFLTVLFNNSQRKVILNIEWTPVHVLYYQ